MKKITRNNLEEHLFEYQFSLIGKTIEDAQNDRNWKLKWSFKIDKYKQFHDYSIKTIMRVLKCNRKKAEKAFSLFDVRYGLNIEKNDAIREN